MPNKPFGPQRGMSLQPLTQDLTQRLRSLLGEDSVRSDASSLEAYGRDETEDLVELPDVVLLPRSPGEVAAVMRLAFDERIAVTPRGAGTGLSGGALPVRGGILLSLERLDDIREIDMHNLTVVAEAGVITGDLQRQVESQGLFYPPDPASRSVCQLGGNLAEDSAGPRSCKYGTTRRWVLGLEAILPDGSLIQTGGKNRKDVTGYNLTQLLVGSEGTLAVITAATLRLISRPRSISVLALPFSSLESGAAAVSELFRAGLDPATCELMESAAIALVSRIDIVPPQLEHASAFLLLEFHADGEDMAVEMAAQAQDIGLRLGGAEGLVAIEPTDRRRLWNVREKIGEAVRNHSVYKEADTVVPRDQLAHLVRTARRVGADHGLDVVCYGHAGDGNLHINILRGSLDEPEWLERRDQAEDALFQAVVEMGGSISGEHGIGLTQRRHLPKALSAESIELMKRVKDAFDPHGILNPGKIFPGGTS